MASRKYKKNKRGEYEARIWDGTYNPDGSKHRKYLVSKKSSADLERQVNELKQEVKERGSVTRSDVSFGEYADRWLAVHKSTKEKNTQRMYKTSVYNYLAPLRDKPLSQITHSDLQRAINENLSHPRTCKDIKNTFSQIIRSASRDRLLPRSAEFDLLSDISLPRYVKTRRRPLSALEKDALKKVVLDDRKAAFLSTLYFTGVRKGEALALTSSDFDWKKKTLSVSRVVIFDGNRPELKPYPKSERGIRTIPLPDEMIDRVKPYAESCNGILWRSEGSDLMSDTAYTKFWYSILTAMNVAVGYNPNSKKNKTERPITGLTAHMFRHNYCTMLCYQIPKISTKMIAQLLGDDERMVLDIYSHILAEKEDVSGAIADAFKS